MAIVNDTYQFIFLFEPHTASRSTRDALKTLTGSRVLGDHHITIHKMNQRNMLSPREKKYKTISTIRNPYDYFITYYMMAGPEMGFSDWLEKYFKHHNGIFVHTDSDYLIRYESLPDSLNDVLGLFNAPPVELGYVGKTKNKPPWQSMYSDRSVKIMDANIPDSLRFGYSFSSHFEGDKFYGRRTA